MGHGKETEDLANKHEQARKGQHVEPTRVNYLERQVIWRKSVTRSRLSRTGHSGQGQEPLRYYCCQQSGYIMRNCQEEDYNCQEIRQTGKGVVEEKMVNDIILSTGCSRTMVRRDLVPGSMYLERVVTIRCAYGDVTLYPFATMPYMGFSFRSNPLYQRNHQ